MRCYLGNPTDGGFFFPRLLNFNTGEPQRRASKFATVSGATVHQVTKTTESDRIITGTMIMNKTDRDILLNIHKNALTLIHTLQTGEEVYEGYISIRLESNKRKNYYRYSLTFTVTAKLT